jgi:chemotaxis signal transduction protein
VSSLSPTSAKVVELRSAFDRERAIPCSSGTEVQTESLLAIRVSRDAYAIRVSEISGLATDRKIVAFPSSIPELLGVAGVRGALVPVYSLAKLLGYGADTGQARWLVLCGTEEPFGLALRDFEGYMRMPWTQLHQAEQQDVTRTHVTHLTRATDMVRAVVSIPLLRETIQERCRKNSFPKER